MRLTSNIRHNAPNDICGGTDRLTNIHTTLNAADFREGFHSSWFSRGPLSNLRQLSHKAADFREGLLSRWFLKGPLYKLRQLSHEARQFLRMTRCWACEKGKQKMERLSKAGNCELMIFRIYSELQMWPRCALSDGSLREAQIQRFPNCKIWEGSVKLAGTIKPDLHVANPRRMLRSSS